MEAIARRRLSLDTPVPAFELQYNGKAITAAIAPYVMRLHYTDHLSDKTDELEIELEDTDERWLDAWYPEKGAKLTCSIGYAGQELISIGSFLINEIELSGPPSVVTIRAHSAGTGHAIRTRRARAYERTTLAAVVGRIAKKNGLKVVGNIEPISIDRITQYGETDLAFLRRLAEDYGYLVKVQTEDKKLVFWRRDDIYERDPVREYRPGDRRLIHWQFTDKIMDVPQASKSSSWNARKKKAVSYKVADGDTPIKGDGSAGAATSSDQALVTRPARGQKTAKSKARAHQQKKAALRTKADIVVYGDQALAAGQKITLTGVGRISGGYTANKVEHTITRDEGYETALELARVQPAEKKGTTKKKGSGSDIQVTIFTDKVKK